MPRANAKPKSWNVYATWIARGAMVLFGAGFIGLAVTVGVYKQKVDSWDGWKLSMETKLETLEKFHEYDKRLAVLEERTKGVNSSAPITAPAVLRPTAGKQR